MPLFQSPILPKDPFVGPFFVSPVSTASGRELVF
jgi:hypothetical protein